MPNTKKMARYSKKDLREVSDNPELTKEDFASAKPFSEVFPDLAAPFLRLVHRIGLGFLATH
jgi:hypothetical protein